jgi:hypothetical protein
MFGFAKKHDWNYFVIKKFWKIVKTETGNRKMKNVTQTAQNEKTSR